MPSRRGDGREWVTYPGPGGGPDTPHRPDTPAWPVYSGGDGEVSRHARIPPGARRPLVRTRPGPRDVVQMVVRLLADGTYEVDGCTSRGAELDPLADGVEADDGARHEFVTVPAGRSFTVRDACSDDIELTVVQSGGPQLGGVARLGGPGAGQLWVITDRSRVWREHGPDLMERLLGLGDDSLRFAAHPSHVAEVRAVPVPGCRTYSVELPRVDGFRLDWRIGVALAIGWDAGRGGRR
ncbi:hypothetical protein GCM10027418_12390 [Mariniluteicoccus endophyticus]